jgi:hypothetical protein
MITVTIGFEVLSEILVFARKTLQDAAFNDLLGNPRRLQELLATWGTITDLDDMEKKP